ncbi:DNA internalization-related competence protein ComEC/Rec2 [Diaphorobacter aerolatus]|uniref:DNA internalization-related competence protein ComEC/Rec2 n=1 Tax=Diaphorobacter aerolatus TaxID=1288495 RepID=A0A7H0GIJ3_9BURK|nr:DNA internalization-related competence protein ComEC/Rec2 [Diaphorobacter aerolatus]QNP48109.1 DNA internalization-related competence protein ComEC/Rec2 [Diaphorobacter aerolatus]
MNRRPAEFRSPWWGAALLLGVPVGTALQLQQPRLWTMHAYLSGLLIAITLGGLLLFMRCTGRDRWRWSLALCMLAIAALATFAQIGLRSALFAGNALSPALEGRDLRIEGTITAMPQTRDSGVRFRMAVESATLAGRAVRLPALIELNWYARGLFEARDTPHTSPPPSLIAGQRWSMDVRLKAPHGAANPFGFDYELWVWEQGVQATGYVRVESAPQHLGEGGFYPVERMRQHVRDAILERLVLRASDEGRSRAGAAGVVAALVTGDQRAIDRNDWDIFRITGVAHLVSISGLHITMFAWLAGKLIGALWRRSPRLALRVPAQTASVCGGVLLATGYAWFSGWGVPAQRTIFMLATVAALNLGGKRWPWPHVWLLACAMVLLWDPWAMLQAGFWLSFVAVGILFASSVAAPGLPEAAESPGWFARVRTGLPLHVKALVHQQAVVTFAVAPLTLLLFGQVSLIGLVANLFAIPWITLAVLPVAFLGIVWHPLWNLALWSVQCLVAVLQWCAALPYSQLSLAVAPVWAGALAVCAGIWLAMHLPWRVRMLALPCLLPALWWTPARPPAGRVELLAIDVGQGQSVLVRTAHHSLLYDAGPLYSADSDAGERVVVPLLRATGERLDMLLLSHRDADHTGGTAAVLAHQPQAALVASVESDHPLWHGRPPRPCIAGDHWQWDGVLFEVLHPERESALQLSAKHALPLKSNAMSCVLRISDAHGVSALLAGDIEQAQERTLLARDVLSPVSYLLVPHHGSKTSSSTVFIDALKPQVAVVQAGYRNRFGHPVPEIIERYRIRQSKVFSTPSCGAVLWRSSAPQDAVCERERGLRYWKHLHTSPDQWQ